MSDYRWFHGRGSHVPVDAVVALMSDLEAEHGAVMPAEFVERSRPADALTHDLFEWDDSAAAESYRLSQARRVISSIKVTFHEHERVAPAFLSVKLRPVGDNLPVRGYVTTQRAMSDQYMRAQVLDEARKQLLAWRTRYQHLQELSDVFAKIDETV